MATDLVVEACLKSGRAPPAGVAGGEEKNKVPAKQLSYSVVDAYVKLVLMLVRDDTFFSSFFFAFFVLVLMSLYLSTLRYLPGVSYEIYSLAPMFLCGDTFLVAVRFFFFAFRDFCPVLV